MINSFARIAICAIAFCSASGAARADTSVCSFDKVTANGMGDPQNTRDFLGEVVTFDTARKRVKVQWSKRTSDWMPAEKILKNNTFTSYIIFRDIANGGETVPMKISFRLFADGSRAEVRSDIQSSPGSGRLWRQNAAAYSCK